MNKIIQFDRPAEFYYKTAQKYLEDYEYIKALTYVRKALDKEPVEKYSVLLAQIYSEMLNFEESNAILFNMYKESDEFKHKCYFLMGCNFAGLNDFDKAKDSFLKAASIDVEGEYSEEIEDFFMFYEEIENVGNLEDVGKSKMIKKALEGKRQLDMGNNKEAIEILKKINVQSENFLFVKNNLALAYYCDKQTQKAIDITRETLFFDKNNVHANCNMALFSYDIKDMETVEKYVKIILDFKCDLPDDVYKIAVTLCEIKKHQDALKVLKLLITMLPYDERVLFYYAMALHNTKRYLEAIQVLDDIQRINPPGYISGYYLPTIRKIRDKKAAHRELGYNYQVEPLEVKRRIKYLNDCLKLPRHEVESMWKNGGKLYDVLIWGMEYGDKLIKKACIKIIGDFKDDEAQKVLKRFILRQNQSDDLKNEVFLLLKAMNAKEPFIAYISGEIAEVKVGMVNNVDENNSQQLSKLFDALLYNARKYFNGEVCERAVNILQKYYECGNNQGEINVLYYAAGMLYLAAKEEEGFDIQTFSRDVKVEIIDILHTAEEIAKIISGSAI